MGFDPAMQEMRFDPWLRKTPWRKEWQPTPGFWPREFLGLHSNLYLLCQVSSAQSCPALCNPMDCSTPGFPVHHQVPELAQTHAHWVCDAMQPSHSLLSPSPPTVNLSQLQGLSKEWALHIRWPKFGVSGSASVLPMNIQDRSSLGLTGLILQSRGISRVFSNITVQKHQFFGAQLSLWSNSYIHTWLLEKNHSLD